MVNGSSSTSRVSSNFALARTAPGVHSTPCRFYFLQMETEVCKRFPPGQDELVSDPDEHEHGRHHRGVHGAWLSW